MDKLSDAFKAMLDFYDSPRKWVQGSLWIKDGVYPQISELKKSNLDCACLFGCVLYLFELDKIDVELRSKIVRSMNKAVAPMYSSVIQWNDNKDRKFEEVRNFLDRLYQDALRLEAS